MKDINSRLKLDQALYGHTNTLMCRIIENKNFYFTMIIIISSLRHYLWLVHNFVPRLFLPCLPWTTKGGRGERAWERDWLMNSPEKD